jgi:hypothetical protein
MKILEAEWWKDANPHGVAPLQRHKEEDKISDTTTSARSPTVKSPEETALMRIPLEETGAPIWRPGRRKGAVVARGARHVYCPGDRPLFKGRSPTRAPEASRVKSPPAYTKDPTL